MTGITEHLCHQHLFTLTSTVEEYMSCITELPPSMKARGRLSAAADTAVHCTYEGLMTEVIRGCPCCPVPWTFAGAASSFGIPCIAPDKTLRHLTSLVIEKSSWLFALSYSM